MFGVSEHTADLIVWAKSRSASGCLEQLALALREVVTGRTGSIHGNPDKEISFRVEAPDGESLLVAYLSELLWLLESEDALWHSGGISTDGTSIDAKVNVVRYDPAKHGQGVEVKAVTYHELIWQQEAGTWHARVLLDI